jgi:N-acetylneuraminic acid mutarotase
MSRCMFIVAVAVLAGAIALDAQGRQGGAGQGGGGGQGRWVRLAPVPETNEERQSVSANGRLYLFGGNAVAGPDGMPTAPPGQVWEYEPTVDRWTRKKPMAAPAHHMAVAESGGRIYLFGGATQRQPRGSNQIPINNAWEYDPLADSWKELAPMPTKRMAAAAVAVAGKIYVMGGAGNYPSREDMPLAGDQPHRVLDINEVYDPATNTWATRTTLPTPRNHIFAAAANGKIYLIGGRLGAMSIASGSPTDIVEEYDPATDRWGFLKNRMPTPRDSGVAAVYQNKIYIAGGQSITAISNSVSRALEVYDPATNTWDSLENIPTARHGIGGGVIGSRLYVAGGHITAAFSGGEPLNSANNDALDLSGR